MNFKKWSRYASSPRKYQSATNPNNQQYSNPQPPKKMERNYSINNFYNNSFPPAPPPEEYRNTSTSNKSRRRTGRTSRGKRFYEGLEENRHSRVPARSRSSSPCSPSEYWPNEVRRKPKSSPKISETDNPDKKERSAIYANTLNPNFCVKSSQKSYESLSTPVTATDKEEAAATGNTPNNPIPPGSYISNDSGVKSHPSIIPDKHTPKIPEKFCGKRDKADWMSKYMTLGQELLCVGAHVDSLNRFYVNSCVFSIEFRFLKEELNDAYYDPALRREATPNVSRLTKGLYVAVACKDQNDSIEYHRGLILKVLRKFGDIKYKIFLIDYGAVKYTTFNEIKYLKRDYLQPLPAQAIECAAYLSPNYNDYAKRLFRWSAEEVRQLKESFRGTIGVEFVKTARGKTYCKHGKKFRVSINILRGNETPGIIENRIEQQIIARTQGKYVTAKVNDAKDHGSTTQDDESCYNSDGVNSEELSWSSVTFSDKGLSEESEMSDDKHVPELPKEKVGIVSNSSADNFSKSICSSTSIGSPNPKYPERPIPKVSRVVKKVDTIKSWYHKQSPTTNNPEDVVDDHSLQKKPQEIFQFEDSQKEFPEMSDNKPVLELPKEEASKSSADNFSKSICRSTSIASSNPKYPVRPIPKVSRVVKKVDTIKPWHHKQSSTFSIE